MHGLTFSQGEWLGYCNLDWPVSRMLWMGTMKTPSPCCQPKNACLRLINFSVYRTRYHWNNSLFSVSRLCLKEKKKRKNHILRTQHGIFFRPVRTLKYPVTNTVIWIVFEKEQLVKGWYVFCKNWPHCSLSGQMSAACYYLYWSTIRTEVKCEKTWIRIEMRVILLKQTSHIAPKGSTAITEALHTKTQSFIKCLSVYK